MFFLLLLVALVRAEGDWYYTSCEDFSHDLSDCTYYCYCYSCINGTQFSACVASGDPCPPGFSPVSNKELEVKHCEDQARMNNILSWVTVAGVSFVGLMCLLELLRRARDFFVRCRARAQGFESIVVN